MKRITQNYNFCSTALVIAVTVVAISVHKFMNCGQVAVLFFWQNKTYHGQVAARCFERRNGQHIIHF